jgi:hypothetical protein
MRRKSDSIERSWTCWTWGGKRDTGNKIFIPDLDLALALALALALE